MSDKIKVEIVGDQIGITYIGKGYPNISTIDDLVYYLMPKLSGVEVVHLRAKPSNRLRARVKDMIARIDELINNSIIEDKGDSNTITLEELGIITDLLKYITKGDSEYKRTDLSESLIRELHILNKSLNEIID